MLYCAVLRNSATILQLWRAVEVNGDAALFLSVELGQSREYEERFWQNKEHGY